MPDRSQATCTHPTQYATRNGLCCVRCGAYLGSIPELLAGLTVSPNLPGLPVGRKFQPIGTDFPQVLVDEV